MKRTVLTFLLSFLTFVSSGAIPVGTDPAKPQTRCPILGDKITRKIYLDHEGKRIYFCCPGCRELFKKKSGRYMKILESKGIDLEKSPAQTNCPIMGGKIDSEVFTDHEGKRIYFCCPPCIDKFKEDPERYIKEMEAGGIALADAPSPQTLCPVMGGKIDKKVFVDYKGKRVYFCCPGCDEAFFESPDRYIRTMEAKGVTLESTPIEKTANNGEGAENKDKNSDTGEKQTGTGDTEVNTGEKKADTAKKSSNGNTHEGH